MAPANVAMGLAAALPALVLGATMLAAARHAAGREAAIGALAALALIGGVALALAGHLAARRAWSHAGVGAMALGSLPLVRSGLALLVLLSAGLLVSLSRPATDERRLRAMARAATAACAVLLGLLAWRDRARGLPFTALDALLWLALLALAGYAWWPARRREAAGAPVER